MSLHHVMLIRVLKALIKYGRHLPGCGAEGRCSCGWATEVKSLVESAQAQALSDVSKK